MLQTRRPVHWLAEADCANCSLSCDGAAVTPVGGAGPRDAALAIVGEAPGFYEVASGLPFSGPSGNLLWSELAKARIARGAVYATNALLCPLPVGKLLRSKDLTACNSRLLRELQALDGPKVILCLGASAATAVSGQKRSMGVMSGRTEWSEAFNAHIVYSYHSAAVLRNPGLYTDFAGAVRAAVRALDAERGPAPVPEYDYSAPDTPSAALTALAALREKSLIVCDLETTGLDPLVDRILDVGFAADASQALLLNEVVANDPDVRAAMKALFEDSKITWIWHNGKFDTKMLRAQYGIQARVDGDTMLLHYCLDERSGGEGGGFHDLKRLAHAYCGAPLYAEDVDSAHMESVPLEIRQPYHAADCVYTFRLWERLQEQAANEPPSRKNYPMPIEVHDRLLVPASNAFAEIELRGLAVDRARLRTLQLDTLAQIETTRAACETLVPEGSLPTHRKQDRFNPNSTKQVAAVLNTFVEYRPVTSTDKTAMHALQRLDMEANRPPNPFLEKVMEYRSLLHTKTTYLDGIESRLSADGRLRGTILIHGTTSGRLSSRDPNLQNLPKDSALKEVFVPSPGHVLCEADYRRLEVGVLAWYSGDKKLAEDFAAADFHWNVAQSVFPQIVEEMEASSGYLAALEDVCKDHAMFADFARRQSRANERTHNPEELYDWLKTRLRRQAKYVSFGIMYGEGAQSLADVEKGLGVSVAEAASFIQQWKQTYPTAVRWLNSQVTLARSSRWVESASGRRRRFTYPLNLATHIANEAQNHPVQALASDICLLALLSLNRELPARGLGNVLLSVHDSILFELSAVRAVEAIELVHKTMTGVLSSDLVSFEIDVAVGPNWGSLQKYHRGAKE